MEQASYVPNLGCGHSKTPESAFYIHRCFNTFCEGCKQEHGQCFSCKGDLVDQDLVQLNVAIKCSCRQGCPNAAIYHCTCKDMKLCEQGLVHVHSKVIKSKRCNPTVIGSSSEEIPCSKCELGIAEYRDGETTDSFCHDCRDPSNVKLSRIVQPEMETLNRDIMQHVDSLTGQLSATTAEMDIMRKEMRSAEKSFHVEVARLKKIHDVCTHENMSHVKILIARYKFFSSCKQRLAGIHESLVPMKLMDPELSDLITKIGNWTSQITQQVNSYPVAKVELKFNEANLDFRGSGIGLDASDAVNRVIAKTRSCILPHLHDCGDLNCFCQFLHGKKSTEIKAVFGPSKRVKHDHQSGVTDIMASDPGCSSWEVDMLLEVGLHEDNTVHEANRISDSPLSMPSSQSAFVQFNNEPHLSLQVTSLRCPFWFFLEKPDMQMIRTRIINTVNNPLFQPIPQQPLKTQELVIIKDAIRYTPRFKRALTKSYNHVSMKWTVKLLDYGRDITVSSTDIFVMPDDLKDIEETCFRACLMNIKPRSNFCFTQLVARNATTYINKYLKPKDGFVKVKRCYKTNDGAVFCEVSSMSNMKRLDWANELINANLALKYEGSPPCFLADEDYCYLAHFYGSCNDGCERVHKCPYCKANDHFLPRCVSYLSELKDKEANIKKV